MVWSPLGSASRKGDTGDPAHWFLSSCAGGDYSRCFTTPPQMPSRHHFVGRRDGLRFVLRAESCHSLANHSKARTVSAETVTMVTIIRSHSPITAIDLYLWVIYVKQSTG